MEPNKVEETVEEEQSEPDMVIPVNELLATGLSKGYTQAIVIGAMPDGKLDVISSVAQLGYLHHMLNRALFEINVYEMNHIQHREKGTTDE